MFSSDANKIISVEEKLTSVPIVTSKTLLKKFPEATEL